MRNLSLSQMRKVAKFCQLGRFTIFLVISIVILFLGFCAYAYKQKPLGSPSGFFIKKEVQLLNSLASTRDKNQEKVLVSTT